MKRSLPNLELNQKAVIDSINEDKLKQEYILELIDFGFLPGTEIYVSQKYSSQNKIVVQIGKSYLSLRLSDAESIMVNV